MKIRGGPYVGMRTTYKKKGKPLLYVDLLQREVRRGVVGYWVRPVTGNRTSFWASLRHLKVR